MQKRPIITAVSLIGIGIVFGIVLLTSFSDNAFNRANAAVTDLGANGAPVQAPAMLKALNDQFAAVSEAVTASVVSIEVRTESKGGRMTIPPDFFRFFGPDGGGEEFEMPEGKGAGSGVIITADGYIVTNNHVVEDAKKDGITVTTNDKKEYKATLVGRDPMTDVAVLKIEGTFTPAHFEQRDNIRVGEWVVAVGNPLGLRSTVTAGIISAMGRGIGIIGSNARNRQEASFAIENFIQTDAAINPGNSGGGLFNLNGSLVGINTAIASQTGTYNGYGFAIPIDMVKSVAMDLMDDGEVQRGYIGVQIRSVDETTAKAVNLEDVRGVQVVTVLERGAAEAAGVEEGDVILQVDGKDVNTSNDLQNEIVLHRAGDKVVLSIWRDGKKISKTVKLKSRAGDDSFADADTDTDDDSLIGGKSSASFTNLGFSVRALTVEEQTEYKSKTGVLVSNVEARGAAAQRGLRSNTVILKADRTQIKSPADLMSVLSSKKVGDAVLFVVKTKDGNKMAITVEVPKENS